MNRGLIVLAAAVICGLGTMYFARNALNRSGGPPDPEIDVVVAAKDIKSGSYLNEQVNGEPVIALMKMKKSAVSPDYFSGGQIDLVSLTDEKTKRWVKYAIFTGEPINKKKLGDPKARPGMPSAISNGKRAITIRVDQESGVAGFINPNDHVDVVATYQGSRTAKILLQNVRVLAAGEHLNSDPEKAHLNVASMTLELTPEDANKIRVASSRSAKLSLMLRGFNDNQMIPKEKEEMVFGESIEEREALRQKYDDLEKKLNLLVAERIEKERPADSSPSRLASVRPSEGAPAPAPNRARSTSIVLGATKFKVMSDSGGSGDANGNANSNSNPNADPAGPGGAPAAPGQPQGPQPAQPQPGAPNGAANPGSNPVPAPNPNSGPPSPPSAN